MNSPFRDQADCGTMHVLGPEGDVQLTWDASDPASVETARDEVRRLREAGYQFFLLSGDPADEVAAGRGSLTARFIAAEEILPVTESELGPSSAPTAEGEAAKRGRGRPARVIATAPLRGG